MSMQPMSHQVMGYDRAITMFSPDGRLLQVEYARKPVSKGSTALGIRCSDGVVLASDKRIIDTLVIPSTVQKVWLVDDHVAMTGSGIVSDARVLVEREQVKAQQHRIAKGEGVDVINIVKDVCDLKQYATQSGGMRPFGVSMIIGGMDQQGTQLYLTDPTGIYFGYQAVAVGEHEEKVTEMLKKEYKKSITVDQALALAVKVLKHALEDDFKLERLDIGVLRKGGSFTRLKEEEVKNINI